jgi:tetratricopeptide (TPR) repeat protein
MLVIVVSIIAVRWWFGRPDVILGSARREAELVLATSNARQRDQHAMECSQLCRELLNQEGRVGTTAALFMIGVGPLSRDAADVELPDARRVEQMLTSDLILVSRLMFHTGRFGPSDQLLDLILSRADDDRVAALRLASMVRFELGRDDDVIRHCDELIRLVPDEANAYRVKAMVHRNHGKWDHFVDAAESAFRLGDQQDPTLQIELIDGYVRLGRTADARREFDRVKSAHPELIADVPVLNAQLLVQEGSIDEAFKIISAYLKKQPEDIDALMLMSKLQIAKGEFTQAVLALKRVIELSPAEELAHYQLGQAYARLGENTLAEESLKQHRSILDAKVRLNALEQLAAREPQNILVRKELARMYLELGLNDVADFWVRAVQAAEGH